MDDFDLLGDFPVGFEDVLDTDDITDADLNFAELSAVDNLTQGAHHWTTGLTSLKDATHQMHTLGQTTRDLTSDGDIGVALRAALQNVANLPSPFRI